MIEYIVEPFRSPRYNIDIRHSKAFRKASAYPV